MKRHIIWCMALVALIFTACKNEDITVSRSVNFKINPYEVISGFNFEVNAGELESFSSDYKLRVHLLVYNENGFLQASDVQYLTNYQSIMNSTLNLPEGNYTAVAITDVVEYNDGVTFQFWEITDTERIAELKVTDAGYIGLKYKILGITNYDFTVKQGNIDHTIRVQPAGALMLMYATNVHYFDDLNIIRYQLDMNKSSDFCTFNNDGSYEVAVENNGGSYDWRLCYFDPADYNNAVYAYYFVLPLGITSFQWYCKDSGGSWYYAGDEMSVNIKYGEEYLIYLELGSEIITKIEVVNDGSKAINLPSKVQEAMQKSLVDKNSQVENPQPLK